jgi:hypothetical protein
MSICDLYDVDNVQPAPNSYHACSCRAARVHACGSYDTRVKCRVRFVTACFRRWDVRRRLATAKSRSANQSVISLRLQL